MDRFNEADLKNQELSDNYKLKVTLALFTFSFGFISLGKHKVGDLAGLLVIGWFALCVSAITHAASYKFCIDKLRENGFMIRYTHPNLLLISWSHWIPSYLRSEIKKKTGINVDGYGNKVAKNEKNDQTEEDPNNLIFQKNKISITPNEDFKSINSYKPTGNLIYNQELLKNIENKSKK